jgi:hypothetical protein
LHPRQQQQQEQEPPRAAAVRIVLNAQIEARRQLASKAETDIRSETYII